MTRNRASRGPLWLIAKQDRGQIDVLTLDPDGEEKALPVFSYEEEAEAFLSLQAPGKGWRARETTSGELVSLLYGLCKSIEKVTLDPLPVAVDGRVVVDLTGSGRESFLRNFLGLDGISLANQVERVRAGKERVEMGNGVSKGSDGLYVPDYVMRDFGTLEDSRNGYDARHRVPEAPDEDLVPPRE